MLGQNEHIETFERRNREKWKKVLTALTPSLVLGIYRNNIPVLFKTGWLSN